MAWVPRFGGTACVGLLVGVLAAFTARGDPENGDPGFNDLSIEQLMNTPLDTVFSASRLSQKTWQAPASVSIVTRDEFKVFGYRTLADALRSTPGIYTTYDRWYTYFGVRGFSRPGDFNSRALLLIDGHRANDNIYDAALVGPEAIVDFDLVDHVEVISGPSSSVYGSNAFFGVYDVIMRRGGSIQGVETAAELGSFNSYKGRITAGYKLDSGLEFLVSGSYYDSSGPNRLYFAQYDTPESNNGIAQNLDYERTYHLYGTLSYQDLTLTASADSREKGIPGALYGAQFDYPGERSIDATRFVDLKYERELANGVHLLSRAAYHSNPYRGWYPINAAQPSDPPSIVINRDIVDGEWWGVETSASRQFFKRLTLITGFEYRDNFRQDQVNLDEGMHPGDAPTVYGDSRTSTQVMGLYTQGDFALRDDLTLSAGVRYDHYSSFGDTVNPRVGLISHPWETTTYKLLYGQAFKAPNVYQFAFDASYFRANPELKPEIIKSYEFVWEQQLPGDWRLTSSAFYNKVDDLIAEAQIDGFLTFQNNQRARAYGAEASVERHWSNETLLRANYSVQRAEDSDTGAILSNAPGQLGKLHLRVPLAHSRVFVGLEAQYVGSIESTQLSHIPGYWLANLTLFSEELIPGLESSLSAYNILNERYANTPSDEYLQRTIPQDGRTFMLELTHKFR